jgi:choline kinase
MNSEKIEVIVLAAGRGSRLGSQGAETPKWLLPLGDTCIAAQHLEAVRLAAAANPQAIGGVRVVTGHAAEAIEGFIRDRAAAVQAIYNEKYDVLNNWYSLLVGLRSLQPSPTAKRICVINADLSAPPEWMAQFILDAAGETGEGLIAVDLERDLLDEAMKVAVREGPAEAEHGLLGAIGKVGVADPAGEYVGMLMARGSVLSRLTAMLESFLAEPSKDDAWYERAVAETVAAGAEWKVWPTPSTDWVEIDDGADLEQALALL